MASDIRFYLNNSIINPPSNWRELSLEVNFSDSEFKSEQITINDWNFVRENIDAVNTWISNGYIFEGIPFRIEQSDSQGATSSVFDGYIDLSDSTVFNEFGITAKSKANYSLDWLNDVATGFSFEYLFSIGVITQSDFIDIPYIISSIPDYQKMITMTIGFAFVTQSLIAAGKDLISAIASLTADPISYGMIFYIIIQILKFTTLLIACILLVKQIFALIIQKVKYHKGISVRRLFEKGCQHLQLTFQSSVIPNDYYIIPKKSVVPVNPQNEFNFGILGAFAPNEFPQFGFPSGTFAQFIIDQKELFNGKIILQGSTLIFERKDFSTSAPQYTIPDIYNPEYTLNTDEFKANFDSSFKWDLLESNTITDWKGTNFQVTVKPINVINQKMVLMRGLQQVNFNYALGKRKAELTPIEKIFDVIGEALDLIILPTVNALNAVIGVINDIIDLINDAINFIETFVSFDFPDIPTITPIVYEPLGDVLDNRIGMLLLQADSFSENKLLALGTDGKLKVNQPSAKKHFDNYYSIDYFSQFKKRTFPTAPLTVQNYLSLKNNPNAFNESGDIIKIESVKFNIWNNFAEIKTKEPYIYTNNLNYVFTEPTGE